MFGKLLNKIDPRIPQAVKIVQDRINRVETENVYANAALPLMRYAVQQAIDGIGQRDQNKILAGVEVAVVIAGSQSANYALAVCWAYRLLLDEQNHVTLDYVVENTSGDLVKKLIESGLPEFIVLNNQSMEGYWKEMAEILALSQIIPDEILQIGVDYYNQKIAVAGDPPMTLSIIRHGGVEDEYALERFKLFQQWLQDFQPTENHNSYYKGYVWGEVYTPPSTTGSLSPNRQVE